MRSIKVSTLLLIHVHDDNSIEQMCINAKMDKAHSPSENIAAI